MKLLEIQAKIKEKGIDGFLFSSKPSVFYLSRFYSTNAYVLLTESKKLFMTDSRYYEGAKDKLKDWEVILLGKKNKKQIEELSDIINEMEIKKLGFEEDRTTVSFYRKLKEAVTAELVGFSGFLNPFRVSKTEEEIEIIRKAVEKTDRVFAYILNKIPQAKDELDLRRMIINQIFLEGGEGESFPSIVASGKNSAVPHHETSHTTIEKNQPVLIDMGMVYRGYCSDFTRTVFYGKVDRELEKIYHIVKEAHLTAVEKVKAGVPVREIDLAARKVIEKYGYGDYFLHSTGHGVGIEIHEPPRVSHLSEEILVENAVITIEPGIYIPGKYGVRLENVVVVRKNSCETLTKTPLQPFKIG